MINIWTMPIKARIDMLSTGIRTPVGVKMFGPDLAKSSGWPKRSRPSSSTSPAPAAPIPNASAAAGISRSSRTA